MSGREKPDAPGLWRDAARKPRAAYANGIRTATC